MDTPYKSISFSKEKICAELCYNRINIQQKILSNKQDLEDTAWQLYNELNAINEERAVLVNKAEQSVPFLYEEESKM